MKDLNFDIKDDNYRELGEARGYDQEDLDSGYQIKNIVDLYDHSNLDWNEDVE